MRRNVSIILVSKFVIALLTMFVIFYTIFGMVVFTDKNADRRTDNIKKIIDKALVQCYALEGGYPMDIKYVAKYGVIFDDDKYVYHYEWIAVNVKPTVIVFELN